MSGKDANSISFDPHFYDSTDLHVLQPALDSATIPVGGIFTDFDGDDRVAGFPDIGADEFNYSTHDLRVNQVFTPVSDCYHTSMGLLKLEIQNIGALPQTGFDIGFIHNDTIAVTENVDSFTVMPGKKKEYIFNQTVDVSEGGEHHFEVFTLLTGDTSPENDSISYSIVNHSSLFPSTNLLPQENTSDLPPPIDFSWYPSAGAEYYDLVLWKQESPSVKDTIGEDIDQIVFSIADYEWDYGAIYEWVVVAKNDYCEVPSPPQSFTLKNLPDLTVANIIAPAASFFGTWIGVSWEIENVGVGTTGMDTWSDYIYLSADNAFQEGVDIYLGGKSNLTALDSMGSYSNITQVKLPAALDGNYYIILVTDKNKKVLEADEANNVAALPILVNISPPADLIVESVIAPNNTFSKTTINVDWVVKNQGGADVMSQFNDRVYLGKNEFFDPGLDIPLGAFSHPPLMANDTSHASLEVLIPEEEFGERFIHIYTDRFDGIFEYVFEDNNVGSSLPINVILTPPPDLLSHDLIVPDSIAPGEKITLHWITTNQGANPVPDHFSDNIYSSSHSPFHVDSVRFIGSKSNSILEVNESAISYHQVIVPPDIRGKQYFYVEADGNDRIFEYVFENNNISDADSSVVVYPDLEIVETMDLDEVETGDSITYNWTVANNGQGGAHKITKTEAVFISPDTMFDLGNATLLFFIENQLIVSEGDSIIWQKGINVPNEMLGPHYLHIFTDYYNQVFENGQEANNYFRDSIFINQGPYADLQLTDLNGLHSSAEAGTELTLSYTATNLGTGKVETADGKWEDRIYISASPVWGLAGSKLLNKIEVQEYVPVNDSYINSWTFELPMLGGSATSGICFIYIIADAKDNIFEFTGESNNILRSDPISVTAPPGVDFNVVNATNLPDTVWSGQKVNLQWSIQNIGNSTSIWDYPLWYDGVYLCEDSLWHPDYEDFVKDFTKEGPVGNGTVYSNSQMFNIPDGIFGEYYAFLVADHTNLTNDDLVSNNVQKIRPAAHPTGKFKPIHIILTPPSDLEASNLSAPNEGVSGQPIQIIYTVKNNGPGDLTRNWADKVYLSTDFNINDSAEIIGVNVQSFLLPADSSYTDTIEATLPYSSIGNFILIFNTDANRSVYELGQESNNLLYNFITITLPTPSDLMVDSLQFPSMAMVSEPFEVSLLYKQPWRQPCFWTDEGHSLPFSRFHF